MPVFQTQLISIVANTSSKGFVLDLATAEEPEAFWARDLTMRFGVFSDDGDTLSDVSDLQSVTISLKDPANLDGTPLVSKVVTVFDNTTTLETWEAGTQQHFEAAFTADDLSFQLGSNGERLVRLAVVAITTGGKTGTLCIGQLNLIDDGGNNQDANPVNAITVTQAQAMLASLSWTANAIALNASGNTNIANAQTWLLGRQPVTVAAGAGAYVANLVLSDANALAGALLRLPIDFAASLNGTINIYDGSTAGTLLASLFNYDATARSAIGLFGFDGAHWHKESVAWVP